MKLGGFFLEKKFKVIIFLFEMYCLVCQEND